MMQELLDTLSKAVAEVKGSVPLRRLLHLVRYAGNRLNLQGSLDCEAQHSPATINAAMAKYAGALKLNEKLLQARACVLPHCCCHCIDALGSVCVPRKPLLFRPHVEAKNSWSSCMRSTDIAAV